MLQHNGKKQHLLSRPVSPFRCAAFFVLLLTFCTACHTTKKLSTPAATVFVADTLPALPISEISLPVKIAGKPILQMADTIIPREFTSDGWPAWLQPSCDFRYKYRFVRSGFIINCVNNKVSLQMTGNYQVAGGKCICTFGKPISPWVSVNCGFGSEPMRRVDIGISSQFLLYPDYHIRTATRLFQLKALDKCVMSVFSMDMTQMIIDSIHSSINSFCTVLDQTMAGLDFRNYLRQAATSAYLPAALGGYGYLIIHPTAIRVGYLNYDKDTFRINVGLSCKPELSSDSNAPKNIPALPPLMQTTGQNGVTVYLQTAYDYKFINKMINDSLRNRSFLVKGKQVIVKDVEIKGRSHHQVEIKIAFTGSYQGTATVTGTPILDTAKQALSVPDISYTLESKDIVLRMAKVFLRNKMRRTLQGNSYIDLKTLLKANLPALDAQLNRQLAPNLYAGGNVKDIRLIGLLAGEKNIQAQVQVNANLVITSTGLPK